MQSKLRSLQCCRGLAALLVLLFHLTVVSQFYLNFALLHSIFLFGYSGVDVFFVLSGFIIYRVHRRDSGHSARLLSYLRKRIVRIYPVYWIVFFLLLPIYFGLPRSRSDFLLLLKSFLLFPQPQNPVVTVAWSLTSEVFFYLLFGLIIWLGWRRLRLLLAAWLIATLIFYIAKLTNSTTVQIPAHLGLIFSAYNLEFALGCFAAWLSDRTRSNGGWLALSGVALFVVAALCEPFLHEHFGRQHSILAYGLPSMIILLGVVRLEQSGARVFPGLLMLTGNASYSIYLTHYALLDLFFRGVGALGLSAWMRPELVPLLAMMFSLSCGILFYAVIERPLLDRLRKQIAVSEVDRSTVFKAA